MSCEHCAAAVTKALGKTGIEKVKVDLKAGTASFNCNPGRIDMDKIKAAVEEAGFEAVI